MAWIACTAGEDDGFVCALSEGQTFSLGRGGSCSIQLQHNSIAEHHCNVTLKGKELVVEILVAGAGVTIDGKCRQKETLRLKPGSVFDIGADHFEYLYSYEQYIQATANKDKNDKPMSREEMKHRFSRLATETAIRRRKKTGGRKSWLRRLFGG